MHYGDVKYRCGVKEVAILHSVRLYFKHIQAYSYYKL